MWTTAAQTVVALDLYFAYLRAAFHTCYYCAVITDHVEELQRKCIKHERKPLVAAASSGGADKAAAADSPNVEKRVDEDGGVEQEKENRDKDSKERREDKRNGNCLIACLLFCENFMVFLTFERTDGRWLEWLDSKIALLIDRDNVDPREYGGKFYEE